MKLVKLLTLASLLALFVLPWSCADEAEPVLITGLAGDTIPQDFSTFEDLGALFDALDAPAQEVRFDPSVDNTITVGGVEIVLPANVCQCSGSDCTDSLTLILKPYLNLNDMFKGNVQTESNGQLLVTGGAFYWDIQDDAGNSVTLANGVESKITVETNVSGFEDDLNYFVGEETTGGGQEIINWNLAQEAETGFEDGVYTIFNTQLGWVNCDALYAIAQNDPTQFAVQVNAPDGINLQQRSVWLFVNDFPSVVNLYTTDSDNFVTYDNSIPRGMEGTLVSIGISSDNVLYFSSLPIEVAGDDLFEMNLAAGTQEDLVSLVDALASN